MHIAILQFSPVLGAVEQNMARADELLRTANTKGLDLLVLPELAFSGAYGEHLDFITRLGISKCVSLARVPSRVSWCIT